MPWQKYYYLIQQLVQKEVKARYKQSIMGYAWVLINPLAQLAVYTFVFSVVIRFQTTDIPYPLFLFSGILPWSFFNSALSSATMSLVEQAPLLRKVRFPREIIPLAAVLGKLVDFLFSFCLLLLLLVVYRIPLSFTFMFLIPVIFIQFIFMFGLSLILSASNLFYRDIQYLVNLIFMVWFYLSPVIYPTSQVPSQWQVLYHFNPLSGILEGYRYALFHTEFPLTAFSWSVVIAFSCLTVGVIFFNKVKNLFADVV